MWWGLPPRGAAGSDGDPSAGGFTAAQHRSVTELVYVPDCVPAPAARSDSKHGDGVEVAVADGVYVCNLQLAAMCLDAAPSRPLLIPIVAAE
jgi:hypothetical protein